MKIFMGMEFIRHRLNNAALMQKPQQPFHRFIGVFLKRFHHNIGLFIQWVTFADKPLNSLLIVRRGDKRPVRAPLRAF